MYNNILVAVDDSNKSKILLDAAIEKAILYHSKLTICHIKKNTIIYTPIDPTGMLSTTHIFKQNFSEYMVEQLNVYKDLALSRGVESVEVVHTYSSSPGLAISEVIVAGYGIDLVICGTSNKSGLDRFLLGSVSNDIVKHAKCDVLIVRNTTTD